ncbi:cytochrome c-type biogenesis protein [Caulobacter endophyticus]|uniref:cytochrome c-type biogenesis protein n=1 Tax=Caulobacter endophyticus TaxID=2172652 RepID=UPI00241040FE|nr:cytochrome c-type biogenesis protein [Caulobacter endophyticus]MDG2527554.1 cytochrome c-type biogenesis protein CcmH [Caulobacter endophyticus]
MKAFRTLAVALAAIACMGAASDPSERLPDPAQEARARDLFKEVRCLVCQNESIDDSEAALAHDLRLLVRDQVKQGRSDDEIRAFLTERYGEFVLLKPPFSAGNAVLWLTPLAVLLAGGGLMVALLRRRRSPEAAPEALSAEEEARLKGLLGEARGDE